MSSAASSSSSPKLLKRCTVIGSSGCLGRELVMQLLDKGYHVNGFDTRQPIVDDKRVNYFTGSLTERKDLLPALDGVDTVFHTASPNYFTKNKSLFHKINVEGTQNVIQCCIEANIARLVATSSGIVVFDGKDNCDKTEDELPYGTFSDEYQVSKIAMEKSVLAANGSRLSNGTGRLWTAAIRPQAIFGPGDSAVVPGLETYKNWTIMFGMGRNTIDYTYSTNVAHGHILAAERMHEGGPVCGEVFNISNDDPVNYSDFIDKVLFALGYRPALRLWWVPVLLFMLLAHVMLLVQTAFQRVGVHFHAPLTPMQVQMTLRSQHHSIAKAKRMLGYRPLVDVDEGVRRMTRFYQELKGKKAQ